MATNTLIPLLALVALLWVTVRIYNRLVHDRAQTHNAWSDIDVQLKRRHDLVPQLVAAVKGYAAHEKATLTAVTELRRQTESASSLPQRAAVEDAMALALGQLLVVAEAYPELKANQSFTDLTKSLVEIEDHLQKSRRFYNGATRLLNTRVRSFPDVIVAKMAGFQAREYFEADEAARVAPQVKLS